MINLCCSKLLITIAITIAILKLVAADLEFFMKN